MTMVGTDKALESEYLTVGFVEQSKSKKFVILGEGRYEETDYGLKLRIPVEIDEKHKIWTPNKDSIKNCRRVWGENTLSWLSKACSVQIVSINGKDSINAVPHETISKE